ncbi:MAG TPA: hypothetical protein VF104_11450, partial [Burkholderiales bacterium]
SNRSDAQEQEEKEPAAAGSFFSGRGGLRRWPSIRRGTDYIDGPIRVTGRLDLGRKLDEMGLESYVRIYDATLERTR